MVTTSHPQERRAGAVRTLVRRGADRTRALAGGFGRQMRALGTDRSGNTTLLFALAVIPIFGSVGAAVDYSRANNARTAMQAALDATALMISKEALDIKSAQVQKKARTYFDAMFNRPDIKNLKVTFELKVNGPGDFTVIADGKGAIDTAFVKLLGVPKMDLKTTAQVRWGFKALELALALDNTGSMAAKNKMTELKAAVKLLFATLKKNSRVQDDTKIAVVPFNTSVNVGTEHADKPWVAYDTKITKANWTGCIGDRDQPNDVRDTAPTGGKTLFPVMADCGTLAKVVPLTGDWTVLEGMVDGMTPAGTTNVTIGMTWAWHALSPIEPLTEGKTVRPEVDKVMILLTDGQNTANRFTTNASQIDARTAQVCENIKAAKIKLFTIRVIEGNATLLADCATSKAMFYDVQAASELKDVFAKIAASLTASHLSK